MGKQARVFMFALIGLMPTLHPFAGASVLGTVNTQKRCTCYVSVKRV